MLHLTVFQIVWSGATSAIKGEHKLSAEQRATLLASSESIGSLLKIERVNEPSPIAKEEGWMYEVKLSCTCDDLFRYKIENASWPPPTWHELPQKYRDEATLEATSSSSNATMHNTSTAVRPIIGLSNTFSRELGWQRPRWTKIL